MSKQQDSPGVYLPPPLLYVATFLAAVWLHQHYPVIRSASPPALAGLLGYGFLLLAIVFLSASLLRFLKTRNTLVTIRPASSLQTSGIYSISRNPMYVGLALVYLGISSLKGHEWHFLLFPVLLVAVQELVIKREEKYLLRRFGQEYEAYQLRVRAGYK